MSSTDKSFENWHTIRELGEGGQGKVYLAKRDKEFRELRQVARDVSLKTRELMRMFERASDISPETMDLTEEMIRSIHQWEEIKDAGLGAIKDFKIPDGEPEASKAIKRLEKEVEALNSIQHPAILRLLDCNTKRFWMATEFHPRGKLSDPSNREHFTGRVLESLEAFRPLVEAIRLIHDKGHVHRDIKPDNIFVASDRRLVLGDFGIVFYQDGKGERVTETYDERVGSRGWMAPWADVPERLESVSDSLDVFPLGKVLWWMISGKDYLRLWYHRRPEHDLRRLFPDDPSMRLVHFILDRCVVENELSCCTSKILLELVTDAISLLRTGGEVLADDVIRHCRVCGLGSYTMFVNEKHPHTRKTLALSEYGEAPIRAYRCDRCGHVQIFSMPPPGSRRAWKWIWPDQDS